MTELIASNRMLIDHKGSPFRERAIWVLWTFLLLAIPFTSFPPVGHFLSYTPVSPMTIIPLLGLIILGLPVLLSRRISLPWQVNPIFGFILAAILSSLTAYFLPLIPYKGATLFDREIRAFATLFVGVLTLLFTVLIPDSPDRIKTTLRIIHLGGVLALVWSTIQAYYVLDGQPGIPFPLDEFHRKFVFRGLFRDRVTGFAFEPSWFGNQLAVLYLPLWSASVVNGYTAFKRFRLPWVEGSLLLWGLILLVLTKSRISLVSGLLLLGILFLGLVWVASAKGLKRAIQGRHSSSLIHASRKGILAIALILLGIGTYNAGVQFSKFDSRLERLLRMRSQMQEIQAEHPYEVIFEVANRLAFVERIVYWDAGLKVFERYPILGVGLGNAGFLIEENLPAYGHRLIEIRVAIDDENLNFLNPKNLWIRLLAETGLVGFTIFLMWVISVGFSAANLYLQKSGWQRMLGTAGILGVLVLIVEGFSIDTFALPQLWVMFGLVLAGSRVMNLSHPPLIDKD